MGNAYLYLASKEAGFINGTTLHANGGAMPQYKNMSTRKLFELEGKVAIITGASKGIGKAIAEALAGKYGAKVVVSSRAQEAVDQVANEIKALGFEATGIACHVGREDQRKALVEQTWRPMVELIYWSTTLLLTLYLRP